jgi:hypothetical protein
MPAAGRARIISRGLRAPAKRLVQKEEQIQGAEKWLLRNFH